MITHAAVLPVPAVREAENMRRGMPAPRCGFGDIYDVAVAWERRFVDCAVCLDLLDQLVVVPGKDLPLRHARPPYVPDHAVYTPWPLSDASERPRGTRWGTTLAVVTVLVVAALVTIIALLDRYNDVNPTPPRPAFTTPAPVMEPPDERP